MTRAKAFVLGSGRAIETATECAIPRRVQSDPTTTRAQETNRSTLELPLSRELNNRRPGRTFVVTGRSTVGLCVLVIVSLG